LSSCHTHAFRIYYYHLLSHYQKDDNIMNMQLPLIDVCNLEKLYKKTCFFVYDTQSQKFSTNPKDYDTTIYYNRLLQGVYWYSFLNICFDTLFAKYPETIEMAAELVVLYNDKLKMSDEQVNKIDSQIIEYLNQIFKEYFCYYNEENKSYKTDVIRTLNRYNVFKL
jgi:hypothetical protein